MAQQEPGESDLIGLVADESLLSVAPEHLPASLGRPAALSVSPARGRVVGVGVTLTGLTLVGGIALVLLGLIELLIGGGGVVAVVALVLGLVLAGTHWGWVHVAEVTAVGLDRRANAPALDQRTRWLGAIAPFTRYEITTRAGDDGSITIQRIRYQPVRHSDRTFTFRAAIELTEVHSGEEPGAAPNCFVARRHSTLSASENASRLRRRSSRMPPERPRMTASARKRSPPSPARCLSRSTPTCGTRHCSNRRAGVRSGTPNP
jgi:hypothetical protein